MNKIWKNRKRIVKKKLKRNKKKMNQMKQKNQGKQKNQRRQNKMKSNKMMKNMNNRIILIKTNKTFAPMKMKMKAINKTV